MSRYLDPTVQTVFILAEGLDIVVRKAERTHQQRGDEHQNHIYIRQLTQQQTRQQHGRDDDESAHGGHTFLADVKGVGLLVTLCLGDVTAFHGVDKPVAEPDTDQQT